MHRDPTPAGSFLATLSFDESCEDVFAAVVNPFAWWSENIQGFPDRLGGQFTYRHQDIHRCTIDVAEISAPTRVVWKVLDSHFGFLDGPDEWRGTEIHFDLARAATTTELRFMHVGLVSAFKCFDVCSSAWDFYLRTSLHSLIRTGRGLPNPLEAPSR
jgi:hypothetical protein